MASTGKQASTARLDPSGRWKGRWLHTATFLVSAYVIASQALLDLPGWYGLGFLCALGLVGVLLGGAALGFCRPRLERWAWLPALFVFYALVRSFSSVKGTAPWDVFASLFSAFLGGCGVAACVEAGVSFRTVVYAQLASGIFQIALILFGLGPETVAGEEDGFRYAGLTGNANELALQLTLGACLAWFLPRRTGVVACLLGVGAVIAALALTGSRKAVLITAFFILLVVLQFIRGIPKERRTKAACLAALPLTLICFAAVPVVSRFGGEIVAVQRSLQYEDSSYRTRTQMIEQAVQLWWQSPILGNGLDAFRGLSGQETYSHNNYVELLCDLGLIGTALFYAIHVQILWWAMRMRRDSRAPLWILMLMFLAADVGYVSYKHKPTVMILMLLSSLAAAPRLRSAKESSRTETPRRFVAVRKPVLRRFVHQT